jgi:hypothetical protein
MWADADAETARAPKEYLSNANPTKIQGLNDLPITRRGGSVVCVRGTSPMCGMAIRRKPTRFGSMRACHVDEHSQDRKCLDPRHHQRDQSEARERQGDRAAGAERFSSAKPSDHFARGW